MSGPPSDIDANVQLLSEMSVRQRAAVSEEQVAVPRKRKLENDSVSFVRDVRSRMDNTAMETDEHVSQKNKT
jgi:hypothetical protein